MGCLGLLVASLAALLGSFLTITTVNLEALNPWLETLGTRPMGPTPVPSPMALVTLPLVTPPLFTPPLWEAIPQHNLTLTFTDPFVSPGTAPPTPPFAFVLDEEEDDWATFAEELFGQLRNLLQLVRRAVLFLAVNINAFQWMHPSAGCEQHFEEPMEPRPWQVVRRLRRRLVSRRPARRALGRAVFGLPSGPLPFLAAVVAPPAPSASLPSLHDWPASPPYPLGPFIDKIRELQNEVKDLKGQIKELRRCQSPPADQPVASGSSGAQPALVAGTAPPRPADSNGKREYSFRFASPLAAAAPVVSAAPVATPAAQPVVFGSSGAQPALVAGTAPLQPTDSKGKCEYSFRFAPPLAAAAPAAPLVPVATPSSSKPPRTLTDLEDGGSDFTFRFSAPAPPPPPQTSLLTSWTEASRPKKPFLSDFFEDMAREGAGKSDGEDA
ncbi:hypothetical protein MMC22_007175 [Lobaria immixta]|nr:hypothetical protein [Lobaria immixta]